MVGPGICELMLLSLPGSTHVLPLLRGCELLLSAVVPLKGVLLVLVVRVCLYVMELLVEQITLGIIVIHVVFVLDTMLAIVYYLLFY